MLALNINKMVKNQYFVKYVLANYKMHIIINHSIKKENMITVNKL